MSALSKTLEAILQEQVLAFRFETVHGPNFDLADPFAPSEPGGFSFLATERPKLTIITKDFGSIVIAPYGDPTDSPLPSTKMVLLGLGTLGLIGWGIWRFK